MTREKGEWCTYRMVPEVDGYDGQNVQDHADDEVDPEAQTLELDHCIANQGAEDGPWQGDNIEGGLGMAAVLVRYQLGHGSQSEGGVLESRDNFDSTTVRNFAYASC